MTRQNIENGNGSWFDMDTAVEIKGDYNRDARRGSDLYITKSGKYIFYTWSRYQGEKSTASFADSVEEVQSWLIRNERFEEIEQYFPGFLATKEV